jgi:hypothetical protein
MDKFEEIIARNSKNYEKTCVQDEKTLFSLQMNGYECKNAMREIASLAWDAGVNFGVDEIWCPERGLKNEQPTKEQFLNSIFNNHE